MGEISHGADRSSSKERLLSEVRNRTPQESTQKSTLCKVEWGWEIEWGVREGTWEPQIWPLFEGESLMSLRDSTPTIWGLVTLEQRQGS